MKVGIVHDQDSQQKVAENVRSLLPDYEVELASARNNAEILYFAKFESFKYDIVVLTISGGQTHFFMGAIDEIMRRRDDYRRPLIVSMTVGVTLDRAFYGTFMFREPADVVLVNKRSDVAKALELFKAVATEKVPSYKVLPSLCPVFDEGKFQDIDYSSPVQTICFAVQTDIPNRENDREYILSRLVEYARSHPKRTVVLKPRHRLNEITSHVQKFPYERILKEAVGEGVPRNLIVSYQPMVEVIEASDLVVSVSSTAIVEAMLLGKRCAIITDLGVTEPYGTSYFINSGILSTFDEIIRDDLPIHSPEWLANEIDAPSFQSVIRSLKPLAKDAKRGDLSICSSSLTRLAAFQRWQHPNILLIDDKSSFLPKKKAGVKLTAFQTRVQSYGPLRRFIVRVARHVVPKKIGVVTYRILRRLRVF